jgi:large subunit ribosomal protein L38e
MPVEIKDVDEFVSLSEKARYCLVKRLKGVVKLKLRTRRMLYTLKVAPSQTDEVLKKLRCEIREL